MTVETCAICDERAGDVLCSCTERYCETCFQNKHLKRRPEHRRGGTLKQETQWSRIKGAVTGVASSLSEALKADENAKWFGLHVSSSPDSAGGTAVLIETPRLSTLLEGSVHFYENSPKLQNPSICSFIGDSGVGKSTLGESDLRFPRG